jgi:hypothetical protein
MAEVAISLDVRKIPEILGSMRQSPPFITATISAIQDLNDLLVRDYPRETGVAQGHVITAFGNRPTPVTKLREKTLGQDHADAPE